MELANKNSLHGKLQQKRLHWSDKRRRQNVSPLPWSWTLLITIVCLHLSNTVLPYFYVSANNFETLIGVVGRDFVLLAADSSVSSGSIAFTKATNVDKIQSIVESPRGAVAVATAGDMASADRLLHLLKSTATKHEYEACAGWDVEYVDVSSSSTHADNSPVVLPNVVGTEESLLSAEAIANLARTQISNQLRSRSGSWNVCLLVAGMMMKNVIKEPKQHMSRNVQLQISRATTAFMATPSVLKEKGKNDDESFQHENALESKVSKMLQPCLFWLDQYGSIQSVSYAAHGLGADLVLSILDQKYNPNLSREEAVALIRSCFAQLRTRYIINTNSAEPCIKCIDDQGCQVIV